MHWIVFRMFLTAWRRDFRATCRDIRIAGPKARRSGPIAEAAMKADIVVHRDFTLAPVDPCLFGVHLGPEGGDDDRALSDPAHPAADETGVRTDVIDLARAYRLPCASAARGGGGPRWVDTVLDLCRRSGMEPMLDLDTAEARADVRMWHLGRAAPDDSRIPFHEMVARLRDADPSTRIALAAPADGADGDYAGLAARAAHVDLLALPARTGRLADLAHDIDALVRTIDRAGVIDRAGRPIGIQVDGWWNDRSDGPGRAGLDRALVVNAMLRRADRVRVAFAGGVVAGIAGMLSHRVGMGHRPSLYDPVLAGSIYGRGVSLMPAYRGFGSAPDLAAVHDEATNAVTLFLANPDDVEAAAIVEMVGYATHVVAEHRLASPARRMPGPPPAGPQFDGRRLSVRIGPGGYGLVRLAPRRS
jgi:hypothetical protein